MEQRVQSTRCSFFVKKLTMIPWLAVARRRSEDIVDCSAHLAGGTGEGGALMRYKPKSIAALHIALGGLPDKMRVEVDPGIQPSPKTVGELRKMTAWPENLAVTTPHERDPNSAVKVSKANVATRTTPKS